MSGEEAAPDFRGIGVSPGTVFGPAYLVAEPIGVDAAEPAGSAADAPKVAQAYQDVAAELDELAARREGEFAEILAMTADLARDKGLLKSTLKQLELGKGVTAAVYNAVAEYALMLESIGGYMAERVTDLQSIRDRVIAKLRGVPAPGVAHFAEPGVVVAKDLSPAQTADFDLSKVLAIVTEFGGPTSHTAILAATLGIPAVVAAPEVTKIAAGSGVLVDGRTGSVWADPDPEFVQAQLVAAQKREEFLASTTGDGQTADGMPVALKVNIGTLADAQKLHEADVQGVGLLRTEFMFLTGAQAPSIDAQESNFRGILEAFAGKPVTVRTLDIGADKPVPFIDQSGEENPALGQRGIRLCQANQELLDVQLSALGNVAKENTRVMAPMVATVAEAKWFAELARAKGIANVGIMIETPAAAIQARRLMERADLDFVSIGTNDLTQYVMAADRLHPALTELNDPWQVAVLELIRGICEAGQATDTHIGVCGEAAGDPILALVLVGLGVYSLSMSAAKVPAVRAALARHTLAQCQELARIALAADSASEAKASVSAQIAETVALCG
ncbi:phosphoenolpyruvate--protein phosphotransferase [Arcanobacterium hippocoleae]|uniref:Phosphoenolpyruvate-protein phosphotransferase n=1 Tax=Arcanobacterium hippocoleae TaxID=149017 RepID=A0ABU1T4K8_9ACTO|nr:phosphoenolpyruvate--protein phosphotransferase [Arcanobacterium hippocoleae]MDR6939780.1 phosphotransferase system enzyme I (PtsI) [Arcanobacterium hippocoleae]